MQRIATTLGGLLLSAALAAPAAADHIAGTGDLQGTVTRNSKTGATYVKIVNPRSAEQALAIEFKGARAVSTSASVETLSAVAEATNSLAEPTNVVPVKSAISGVKPSFTYTVPAYSITVLQLKTK